MKKLTLKETLLYSSAILAGVMLDQLTKLLAVIHLIPLPGRTFPIIESVLHFTYHENTGMAFSLLGEANQRWIFILVSIVTIIGLGIYLFTGRVQNRIYTAGILLILSGGIGNMIDRIALGYVVDFIDFRLINFAVFNVADSFVTVGAGILITTLILDIIKEARAEKKE